MPHNSSIKLIWIHYFNYEQIIFHNNNANCFGRYSVSHNINILYMCLNAYRRGLWKKIRMFMGYHKEDLCSTDYTNNANHRDSSSLLWSIHSCCWLCKCQFLCLEWNNLYSLHRMYSIHIDRNWQMSRDFNQMYHRWSTLCWKGRLFNIQNINSLCYQ